MKLVIPFLSLSLVSTLTALELKVEPSMAIQHTEKSKEMTFNDQRMYLVDKNTPHPAGGELYVVDNLVYAVSIEAGTPTLALVGKLKSEDHTASVGIKNTIEQGSAHPSTAVISVDLTKEDMHALKSAVETVSKVSLDGRLSYKENFKKNGEKTGDLGFEFMGGYLLDTKLKSKKDDTGMAGFTYDHLTDVKGSGPRMGMKIFGSYKALFAEVGFQFGTYSIKTNNSFGYAPNVSSSVDESIFEARVGANLSKNAMITFYAKTRSDVKSDDDSYIYDGSRVDNKLIIDNSSTTLGAEVKFPFQFGKKATQLK